MRYLIKLMLKEGLNNQSKINENSTPKESLVVKEETVDINKDNVDKYLQYLKNGGKLSPSDLIDLRYALREKHKIENNNLYDKIRREGGKMDDAYIYSKNPDSEGRKLGKKQKEEMDMVINQSNSFGLQGDINAPTAYHFTDPLSILNILDDNHLYGEGEVSGVSTTTNKGLGHPELTTAQQYGEGNKPITFANKGIRIDLDLQKIIKDGIKVKVGNENLGTFEGEEELKIGGYDGIKDLSKYIKQIEVDKKVLDQVPVKSPYHVSFEDIKKAAEKHGIKVVEKTDYERPRNQLSPLKLKQEPQQQNTPKESLVVKEETPVGEQNKTEPLGGEYIIRKKTSQPISENKDRIKVILREGLEWCPVIKLFLSGHDLMKNNNLPLYDIKYHNP